MYVVPDALLEKMKELDLLFRGWQMGLPLDKTKQYQLTPDQRFLIEINHDGHNQNNNSEGAAS